MLVPSQKFLDLREDDSKVSVAGLTLHRPSSVEQVMQMLIAGNANRTQAFTEANAASSRSHAILQVHVRSRPKSTGIASEYLNASLNIIDLAGSERASNTKNVGDRMIEGANINRSLLALGNCINALCDGKTSHVPYRLLFMTR